MGWDQRGTLGDRTEAAKTRFLSGFKGPARQRQQLGRCESGACLGGPGNGGRDKRS